MSERLRKLAEDTYPPIKEDLQNNYSDSAVRAIRVQEFMYGYEQAVKDFAGITPEAPPHQCCGRCSYCDRDCLRQDAEEVEKEKDAV